MGLHRRHVLPARIGDLAQPVPVASGMAVRARIGAVEHAAQQRTVDGSLAAPALALPQDLRDRNELRIVVAVDARVLGEQSAFGGLVIADLEQHRGGRDRVVVVERQPAGARAPVRMCGFR